MYAMVAIGFVLIYKASGVFNFAQGSLVLAGGRRGRIVFARRASLSR